MHENQDHSIWRRDCFFQNRNSCFFHCPFSHALQNLSPTQGQLPKGWVTQPLFQAGSSLPQCSGV